MRVFKIMAILGIVFLSCKKQKSPMLKLFPPEWKNGEITRYALVVGGDTIGNVIYTVNEKNIEGKDVYEIYVLTEVQKEGQKTKDYSTILVDKESLKTIRAKRTLEIKGAKYITNAEYLPGKVKISLEAPQGKKNLDLPIPENSFDNEMVTMLLRNIPFEQGFTAKITSVVPLSGASVPIEIYVKEKEKISVPAGEFETRKVNLKFAGREINIWYNEKSPREMVKYEDKQSGVLMLLLSKKQLQVTGEKSEKS